MLFSFFCMQSMYVYICVQKSFQSRWKKRTKKNSSDQKKIIYRALKKLYAYKYILKCAIENRCRCSKRILKQICNGMKIKPTKAKTKNFMPSYIACHGNIPKKQQKKDKKIIHKWRNWVMRLLYGVSHSEWPKSHAFSAQNTIIVQHKILPLNTNNIHPFNSSHWCNCNARFFYFCTAAAAATFSHTNIKQTNKMFSSI